MIDWFSKKGNMAFVLRNHDWFFPQRKSISFVIYLIKSSRKFLLSNDNWLSIFWCLQPGNLKKVHASDLKLEESFCWLYQRKNYSCLVQRSGKISRNRCYKTLSWHTTDTTALPRPWLFYDRTSFQRTTKRKFQMSSSDHQVLNIIARLSL